MKKITLLLFFLTALPAMASTSCQDFAFIKKTMIKLDTKRVEQILPKAEWLDEKYRQQDKAKAAGLVGKTVILLMLKRLSFLSYVFEPTRAGVSSRTGFYVSSPQNFVQFLSLEQKQACFFLDLPDTHAEILRQLTRDVALELRRAQK